MSEGKYNQVYLEEANELLDSIEKSLIELEQHPDNIDLINNSFRALHTIKGSGRMFGFNAVAGFTHELESLFDQLRNGEKRITKSIIDLSLAGCDYIRELLGNNTIDEDEIDQILVNKIKGFTGSKASLQASEEKAEKSQNEDFDESAKIYRIQFKPSNELFLRGNNPIALIEELASLGELISIAYSEKIPPLEELNPEFCYMEWTFLLTTEKGVNAIKDVFIFVEEISEIMISEIENCSDFGENNRKKIGELLLERKDISVEELSSILRDKPRFGEIAVEKGIVSAERVDAALDEQAYINAIQKKKKEHSAESTIRVNNKKLDKLLNLVGELVTIQAKFNQYSLTVNDADFTVMNEQLDRLISELRDNTMYIRMVPLAQTFSSFKRLIRDLSNHLGKEIELITIGGHTELDKNVIEELKDPLMHIIRNSADHGIEPPAIRKKLGKPNKSKIEISAEHVGAYVTLRIKDDGKGLDTEKIKAIALSRGLMSPEDECSEQELYNFIFTPGFSTSETTTDISGRGVGMDVVKKNIEKLRGSIEIESKIFAGTTVTIKIPLTLAIIDGLLLEIGDEKFILSLNNVSECFDFTEKMKYASKNNCIVAIRGEQIPYIDLRELFDYDIAGDDDAQLIIIEVKEKKIGLIVDRVIGKYQTVIKSIGSIFKEIKEISGSTILGDGTIALILDVDKILKCVESTQKREGKTLAV